MVDGRDWLIDMKGWHTQVDGAESGGCRQVWHAALLIIRRVRTHQVHAKHTHCSKQTLEGK